MNVRRARRYDRPAPELSANEIPQLAIPKRVPEGPGVDYTTLAHPKDAPDRERGFLDLVRGELCAVNADHHNECGGVTEAAHLQGHGTGIKASDDLTAPLCTIHHRIQHDMGIAEFQIVYGVNLWQINSHLLVRWIRRIDR
jgi:hypothetical protein